MIDEAIFECSKSQFFDAMAVKNFVTKRSYYNLRGESTRAIDKLKCETF